MRRAWSARSRRASSPSPGLLCGDFAAALSPCAFLERGSEPQARIDNKAGALIAQNEWDSQTPLFAARAMHRALCGSRMLTVAGGEDTASSTLPTAIAARTGPRRSIWRRGGSPPRT
ncbi:alpha/beta hydrolase [Streptomyces alboflavus]|uniref:alpha/beta hydrolase n=1 Tax=Streptomyces alboflavus TaxID=67267 RepID=UPI001F343F6C|nr:alpha/beta hydrolase [Streptomyces alboflavus]